MIMKSGEKLLPANIAAAIHKLLATGHFAAIVIRHKYLGLSFEPRQVHAAAFDDALIECFSTTMGW